MASSEVNKKEIFPKTSVVRRRKPRCTMTPEVCRRMTEMHAEGRSHVEIAKEIGCDRVTVGRMLKKLGVLKPRTNHIWTDDERRGMADLYAAGRTQIEIARQFGCREITVRESCRQFGVKLRPRGNGREFTSEDHQCIAEMYESGTALLVVAEEFHCSKKTIEKILRSQGVELRHDGCRFVSSECNEIAAMYEKGLSQDKIAKKLGTDEKTIARTLRRSGVPIRSDGKRHFTEEEQKEMARLYQEEEYTQSGIGAVFSCSQTAVYFILKKLGVKARPRWKPSF